MYDVIIVGGGAAGTFCAKQLNRNIKYLILEKNNEPLKKLSISGGGRCNFTNNLEVSDFVNHINHVDYFKKSMEVFSNLDIIDYFKKYIDINIEGIKIYPKSNKSVDVVNVLVKDLNIKYNEEVKEITKEETYVIKTEKNEYHAKNVVISTGGMSYAHLGSSGDGYRFAAKFNQKVIPPKPALVPLYNDKYKELAGISTDVTINCEGKKTSGTLLFTHKGISGPAIFSISEHVQNKINIDFTNESLIDLQNINITVNNLFRKYIPKRVSDFLLREINLEGIKKLNELKENDKKLILETLSNYEFDIMGKGKMKTAIVTKGGISIDEVSSKTYESKSTKGLFFIGEVVDLHGETGGFNISIAFITAKLAADKINKKEY